MNDIYKTCDSCKFFSNPGNSPVCLNCATTGNPVSNWQPKTTDADDPYSGTCANCGGQLMADFVFCPYCGQFAKQTVCKAAQFPCELADDDGICKIPECIKPGKRADLTGPTVKSCWNCARENADRASFNCIQCARPGNNHSNWQPVKGGDRP